MLSETLRYAYFIAMHLASPQHQRTSNSRFFIDIARVLGMHERTPGLAAPSGAGNLYSAKNPQAPFAFASAGLGM